MSISKARILLPNSKICNAKFHIMLPQTIMARDITYIKMSLLWTFGFSRLLDFPR